MNDVMKLEGTEYIIDKILFASNYPILFTCLDSKQVLYICVCCQNNMEGKKWLLAKTTPKLVIDMLMDQITIRDIFLKFPNSRITIFADSYNIITKNNEEDDWKEDSIYLPQAGEYMEAEDGEFDEEIEYYSRMDEKYYSSQFFETKIQYKGYADLKIEVSKNIPENDTKTITSHILIQTLNTSLKLELGKWQQQFVYYGETAESIENVKVELGDLSHVEIEIQKSGNEGVFFAAA